MADTDEIQGPPKGPGRHALARLSDVYDRKGLLFHLHADVTYRCPLVCGHCYLGGSRHSVGDAPTADWLRLFRDAAGLRVFSLMISGGDPMARPDFWTLVEAAHSHRFVIGVKTTGWFVDRAAARRFAGYKPITVDISVHGNQAGTHDAMTGVSGSWSRAIAAVDHLFAEGVRTRVAMSAVESNLDEALAVRDRFRPLGIESMITTTLLPAIDGTSLSCRSAAEDRQIDLRCRLNLDLPSWEPTSPSPKSRLCNAGRIGLTVVPDGTIQPCPTWPIALGDIRSGGLEDALRSPQLARIRRLTHADRKGCTGCPDLAYCAFCAAAADLESNDPCAPNRFSCEGARVAARMHSRLRELRLRGRGVS